MEAASPESFSGPGRGTTSDGSHPVNMSVASVCRSSLIFVESAGVVGRGSENTVGDNIFCGSDESVWVSYG